MFVLGLTGSLGMGKSTVARMFMEAGAAAFDADAAVHALYRGEAAPLIEAAFEGTTLDGAVDRERLARRVVGDDAALARLERIVHPLVLKAEDEFRRRAAADDRRFAVLDIPLLYETRADRRMDATVVVTTTPEIQRERVLGRQGMTEERFAALLARQLPDAEKRARAHFIIDTSGAFDVTGEQVVGVMRALSAAAGGR